MQTRVFENPKIQILFNTTTEGLFGQDTLEGAHLIENVGTSKEDHFDINLDGFFLAIGHTPNTSIFGGKIDLDENGFIKTAGETTATNIPGVFAAGDVADNRYQQAVVAAGMGCRAALDAERFLLENE